MSHFNAKWYNDQLELEIIQFPKIFDDAGKVFTAPMHALVNKYSDALTKLGKPITQDIKHKVELLDPAKPIPHHKLQRVSERELQEITNHLQEYIEKG